MRTSALCFSLALVCQSSVGFAQVTCLSRLDGRWVTSDHAIVDGNPHGDYGFEISNGIGVAILSNSPNYLVGEVMIEITDCDDLSSRFWGKQTYTDGNMYNIEGIFHEQYIEMIGLDQHLVSPPYNWLMYRQ